MALAGAFLLTLAPTVSAAAPKTEASQIIKVAKQQLGDRYRYGASGPNRFDCSGLVIYAYKKAGDGKVVANGHKRSAAALYRYFKAKGLASKSNPKPGDIVVWGVRGRITHVGIYIGNGKAISALTNGVRTHKVHAVTAHLVAYLHTGMWKKHGNATATLASHKTKHATKATATHKVRHAKTAVNLRSKAGLSHHRIAVVRSGAKLTILGKAHDGKGRTWYHVRVGSRTGYVAGWLTR